jgi:predicted N-acyltransferase
MHTPATTVPQPQIITDITDIPSSEWDVLLPRAGRQATYPFMRHAYLAALEKSGCVGREAGWYPHHFVWRDGSGALLALAPAYLKTHSFGEFVFDWVWADAYQRHGVAYYPKLVTAVPFTPVEGPRLLVREDVDPDVVVRSWLTAVGEQRDQLEFSSWHLLFGDRMLQERIDPFVSNEAVLRRTDVNFLWHNRDYASFEAFLATLKARKRNQIRKERQKVVAQGIEFVTVMGNDLTHQQRRDFYTFYQATYWKRGQVGYLTQQFFDLLLRDMPESLLFIFAQRDDQNVAGALFLLGDDTLHGRYWGSLEEYKFLHFETTLYQGIDYCVQHKLRQFDAGAQGEHKLRRGFEPFLTRSYHWLAHPAFRTAVAEYLVDETAAVEAYQVSCEQALPFRADQT